MNYGITACSQPSGYVQNSDDCAPNDANSYPFAQEVCDGQDNDCDGTLGGEEIDTDGDGFIACVECDDSNAQVNPSMTELCDGIDNNCDGQIDEAGALGETIWYLDYDADGYGEANYMITACNAPAGYVDTDTDCHPLDSGIYPGAPEGCDGVDTDCDGLLGADEIDNDGDGFIECTDCDDDVSTYPGATQLCDGIDHDCDGLIDFDADQDGFSDASCGGLDCLDSDDTIFPDLNNDCNYCGDGVIDSYENCDDGNFDVDDGCSDSCEIEENTICSGEPSNCETDAEPDTFSFTDTLAINFDTPYESDVITLSGFHGSLLAEVSSTTTASLIINGVDIGGVSYYVQEGDTIAIQMNSSPDYNTEFLATLQIGNLVETWSLKTVGECVSGSQSFTSSGQYTLDVTSEMSGCVFSITVKGGGGGSGGGICCGGGAAGGGATFDFSPGATGTFDLLVGGGGANGSTGGGFGGGGMGADNLQGWLCGGGGGASAINFDSEVLAISGGGGAAGGPYSSTGTGGGGNNPGLDSGGTTGGGNNIGGLGNTHAGVNGGDGGSNGSDGTGASTTGGTPGDGGIGIPEFMISGGGGAGTSSVQGGSGRGGGGGYGGGGGGALHSSSGGGGYANLMKISNLQVVPGANEGQTGIIEIVWSY